MIILIRVGTFVLLALFIVNMTVGCKILPLKDRHSTYDCLHMIYVDPRGADGFDVDYYSPETCTDCHNEKRFGAFIKNLSEVLDGCQAGRMDYYWSKK